MACYPLFVRPGHLHTASRVLSCSEESGLAVAPAIPSSVNLGQLRIRATGHPRAAASYDLALQTGGNPYGYADSDAGVGAGSALRWKLAAEAGTLYRGYNDSIYHVSTHIPLTWTGGALVLSHLRTMPLTGDLAYIHTDSTTNLTYFDLYTTAGVLTSASITGLVNAADFVILPSGRLIAVTMTATTLAYSWYSNDGGATWTRLRKLDLGANALPIQLEYVDDMIVAILSDPAGGGPTSVYTSQDGGSSFSLTDDSQTLNGAQTCVTPTGKIAVASRIGVTNTVGVQVMAPGGGFYLGTADLNNTDCGCCVDGEFTIVCRDDGVLVVFGMNATGASNHDMEIRYSLDEGLTWVDPTGGQVVFSDHSATGAAGFDATPFTGGNWDDRIVVSMTTTSQTDSDLVNAFLIFGGWGNCQDRRIAVATNGQPYEYSYLPIALPENLGWTRTNLGGGAAVTNQGPLRIGAGAGTATLYTASATEYPDTIIKRTRFRVQVTNNGSTADDRCRVLLQVESAGQQQAVKVRFSYTQTGVFDINGAQLSMTNMDNTKWTDWLVAIAWGTGAGTCYVAYKQAGDATWTVLHNGTNVGQAAGANREYSFGGSVVGSSISYWSHIGIADDDNSLTDGFTNPDDLYGRSLPDHVDYCLENGISVGGRNVGGIAGDTYDLATTYLYGKEHLWAELRPSRQVRSTADAANWNVVLDSGANDRFKGNCIALFGTNMRTAYWQLHTADAWGAPTVSIALDATVDSFAVGWLNRGHGFVGLELGTSHNWRPGQYKSDLDAHRWFIEIVIEQTTTVLEITDNDEDRIYVDGVDLSGANGTARIFGDKMGAILTRFEQYRYARLYVPAQATADGQYRAGTPIFDKLYMPVQRYDHGFVDRVAPNVEIYEPDAGYRSTARLGPRRWTLAVQWPPLNALGPCQDLERRIADLFMALEGSHRPLVFWRDPSDLTTLQLVRVVGTYAATNLRGELADAVSRIDQLILEEEW